uniref:Uncharacterized protein n=1 Tax=Zea mays TaxID=4577 RepID=C4J3Z9_MAIZE|nr:unknown [Zea mays]
MQSAWNACAHSGSARSSSPPANSSRHTAHSLHAPPPPPGYCADGSDLMAAASRPQ